MRKLDETIEIPKIIEFIGDFYNNKEINFNLMKIQEVKNRLDSESRITGLVKIPEDPLIGENLSIFIHEIFHQFQYQVDSSIIKINSTIILVKERIQDSLSKIFSVVSPYLYSNYIDINNLTLNEIKQKNFKLTDIKTMEGQAEFIQNYVDWYLRYQNLSNQLSMNSNIIEYFNKAKLIMEKITWILRNSGLNSKNINEFL